MGGGAQTFILEPGTFILEPALLDYWRGFDPTKGLEESKLTRTVDPCFNRLTIFDHRLVDPCFNRLTIFDPRLPHGVREVRGTRDQSTTLD
ncbi:hypothetical protein T484DRAFT_1815762 [Baffinella frigidus]|nr:hypothetical protein T484DRAFT_1815762 [Cryptophyta sp. CCMP2293]